MPKTIKLEWSEVCEPNCHCPYHHTYADTPFGRFLITWKGWKDEREFTLDLSPCGEFYYGSTLDETKQAAQNMFDVAVYRCLAS